MAGQTRHIRFLSLFRAAPKSRRMARPRRGLQPERNRSHVRFIHRFEQTFIHFAVLDFRAYAIRAADCDCDGERRFNAIPPIVLRIL